MKPVIKAIALDKDGVVFDTERLIYRAFRELIVRERLPIRPELFEELVGKPPQVYLQVLNEALGQAMSLDDFIARWFALRDEIFADEGGAVHAGCGCADCRSARAWCAAGVGHGRFPPQCRARFCPQQPS